MVIEIMHSLCMVSCIQMEQLNMLVISVSHVSIIPIVIFYFIILLWAIDLSFKMRNVKGRVVFFSMTMGLLLCFAFIVSYGLQRNNHVYLGNGYDELYDSLCLSNIALLSIAFTFTFLAFITSKSELMRILVKWTNNERDLGKYHGDKNVVKKLFHCLCLDITILTIWIIVYIITYIYDTKLQSLDVYKLIVIINQMMIIKNLKHQKQAKLATEIQPQNMQVIQ